MKADPMGSYTEQVRARMGWKSPAQLRHAEVPPGLCRTCNYFYLKEIPNRDGGCCNSSPYCGHPMSPGKAGHATRESARCDRWGRKP